MRLYLISSYFSKQSDSYRLDYMLMDKERKITFLILSYQNLAGRTYKVLKTDYDRC